MLNRFVKVFIFSLLFLPGFSMASDDFTAIKADAQLNKGAYKFPKIIEISGAASLQSLDGKEIKIKAGQILKERVRIQTQKMGRVSLQLNAHEKIILNENTEILIPNIDEDLQQIPLLDLKYGSFRWTSTRAKDDFNKSSVSLISALTQFVLPPGVDAFFEFLPALAYFEVKVIDGEVLFGAFNSEEKLLVKSSQKLKFIGEIESGELQYDTLLKGKKIPRGQLGKIEKFDYASELKKQIENEKRIEKEKQLAEQAKNKKILEQKTRFGEYICILPRGKLNQCMWRCEDNKGKTLKTCLRDSSCVRYRCNLNGDWSERTKLPQKEFCLESLKKTSGLNYYSFVDNCNY